MMLYSLLQQAGEKWAGRVAVARGGRTVVYGQLAAHAEELAKGALASLAGRSVGLALPDGPDWVAVAAALDRLASRAFLLGGAPGAAAKLAQTHGLAAVIDEQSNLAPPQASLPSSAGPAVPESDAAGEVVLFTSGTSSVPKAVVHTWASLASGIRSHPGLDGVRMLLAYECSRYAGLQVLLTALVNGARLSVPDGRSTDTIAKLIVADRIELVSGTPTFWRMLLAQTDRSQRARMPLRQITLGGEPIDQGVLDSLRRCWPAARITHIYASTEMGVCFSVHDGREGFPADFLDSDRLPVRLQVRDGRLWVRSKRAMRSYLGGAAATDAWFDTGDAVAVRGDRVHFLGRRSSRINVGGDKVYPEEVESVIREVAGVADVRVSDLASSIVGQVVQAEVVPAAGADPEQLKRQVLAHCRARLAAYKQPRVVQLVSRLETDDTMKVARRNT